MPAAARPNAVQIPAQTIPVLDEAEVVVVGGSPTGVAAAVAAARSGAKTVLVERFSFLGGQTSAGLMLTFHRPFWDKHGNRVVGGIPVEMIRRAIELNGTADSLEMLEIEGAHYWERGWTATAVDPEVTKRLLQEMALEAGVTLYLDSWIAGPFMDGSQVCGVILETRTGPQAIYAHAVVDATGDAHVAARAGAEFQIRANRFQPNLVGRLDGLEFKPLADYVLAHYDSFDPHPPGLPAESFYQLICSGAVFALIGFQELAARARAEGLALDPHQRFGFLHTGGGRCMLWRNNLSQMNPLDPRELSWAYTEGRRRLWSAVEFYRGYVPGMPQVQLLDTAVALGVRETRRIVGDYMLSEEDVLASQRFSDVVHRSIGHDQHLNLLDGVCDIPYRALLPRQVEGLLVAGRSISCTAPRAIDAIRGVIPCAGIGQAAGVAAALSARLHLAPRQVPVADLQQILVNQGVIL